MQDDQPILIGVGMIVITLVVIGIGLLLVWFAVLRENQLFWTNAGGYPVWLRDLVLVTYLPLLAGTVSLLCGLSMACFAKIGGGLRFFAVESLLIFLAWGILTTSGYIAFENNVRNLINSVPIHSHQ
jgi:hypothetical protein